MKRKVLLLFLLLIGGVYCFSQTENYRAQGYYYHAKELYESNQYSKALPYILKAKDTLGGTNDLIQYLHIMCAVNLGDWITARNEMKVFFDLEEGRLKPKGFSKVVEHLTPDETKALSKAMVRIEENAAYQESPQAKIDKARSVIKDRLYQLAGNGYSQEWKFSPKDFDIKYTANEDFIMESNNRFTLKRKYLRRSVCIPCSSNSDTREQTWTFSISFSMSDISSVIYVSNYTFHDFNYATSPMIQSPALLIKLKKVVKYDRNERNWKNNGTDENYGGSGETNEVYLRIKNYNPSYIDQINAALPDAL